MLAVELLLIVVTFVGGRAKARRIEACRVHFRCGGKAANADLVRKSGGSEPLCQIERGSARLSLLGGDDDHAVGSSRAVDRARRGPLQYLNGLDVIRVDVGRAVDPDILARTEVSAGRCRDCVEAVRDRGIVHDDAVDDIYRLERGINRRNAAQLDLYATSRCSRVLRDKRAGYFPLERVIDRLRRNTIQFLTANHSDVVRCVGQGDSSSGAGDDLRLELQNVTSQTDVAFRRAGWHRDALLEVADPADAERRWAVVGSSHREASLIVGVGSERGADDTDARVGEWYTAAFVSDASANAAALRKGAGACDHKQQQ